MDDVYWLIVVGSIFVWICAGIKFIKISLPEWKKLEERLKGKIQHPRIIVVMCVVLALLLLPFFEIYLLLRPKVS